MRIAGIGSAIPKKVVTNEMLSEFLETSTNGLLPGPVSENGAYYPMKNLKSWQRKLPARHWLMQGSVMEPWI